MSMRFAGLSLVVFFALGCTQQAARTVGGSSQDPGQATEAELMRGSPVYAAGQGTWQVFYLPAEWTEKHWTGAAPARVYLALAPPHPEDLELYTSTCSPPPRIILGIVDHGGTIREHRGRCVHYCAAGDRPGHMHRDLWGPQTHLQGVTLRILDDGTVDVVEHFRKIAFMPPEVYEDPKVIDRLRFEEGTRIRHEYIKASEFVFQGREAGSCAALEEGE